MEGTREMEEVNQCHQPSHNSPQTGGKSCSHYSPTKFEDEYIIQYDIEYGCNCITHHGIGGRTIQADAEHSYI